MSTEYRPLASTENLNLAYEKVNLFLSLWFRNTWLLVGVRWGSGGVRDWWKVEPDYPKAQHIAQLEKETSCIMMQAFWATIWYLTNIHNENKWLTDNLNLHMMLAQTEQ